MTETVRPLRISVAGSSSASKEEIVLARKTGELIAGHGAILVCGGLGGVMEAACLGAVEAGGTTVGILPGASAKSANPHVTIPLPTGLGEARNALVATSSDALIAIGGKLGTLSEIALALRAGIPVVALRSWEIDEKRALPFVLHIADTPEDAVNLVIELIKLGT